MECQLKNEKWLTKCEANLKSIGKNALKKIYKNFYINSQETVV